MVEYVGVETEQDVVNEVCNRLTEIGKDMLKEEGSIQQLSAIGVGVKHRGMDALEMAILPFPSFGPKEIIQGAVVRACRRSGVKLFGMLAEAWFVELQDKDFSELDGPVREHPDRKECMVVMVRTKNNRAFKMFYIERGEDGVPRLGKERIQSEEKVVDTDSTAWQMSSWMDAIWVDRESNGQLH